MKKQIDANSIEGDKILTEKLLNAQDKIKDLKEESNILKTSNLVEREKVKRNEKEKLDLLDKCAQLERSIVNNEQCLIEVTNNYEESKKQAQFTQEELEKYIALEQKLRRELNRNLNQDFDLKKRVNANAELVDTYCSQMQTKDEIIYNLNKDLRGVEEKALNLAKLVDKKRYDGQGSGMKRSISSYYPFIGGSSTKKGSRESSPTKSLALASSGYHPIDFSNMYK